MADLDAGRTVKTLSLGVLIGFGGGFWVARRDTPVAGVPSPNPALNRQVQKCAHNALVLRAQVSETVAWCDPLASGSLPAGRLWSSDRPSDWTFSASHSRPTVIGMAPAIRSDLVDRLIELYCDWRAGCEHVRMAYKRFLDAPAPDRAAAFAAYTAALDQEESACDSYASQIRMIQSRFAGAVGPLRVSG